MAKVIVTFETKSIEASAALIDAINEFGRASDIDELLERTPGPSGEPEGDWTIVAEGVK